MGVVVVIGFTVVEVIGAVVAVIGATRVIVFFDDFAGYFFDLAIFSVTTHEPVEPIVSFVGFFVGVSVHIPVLDHVFAPGEFVETIADKFFDSPAAREETFHVTVVDGAADMELLAAKVTRATIKNKTPPERREGKEMITRKC